MSLLQEILSLNKHQSEEFCAPKAKADRLLYLNQHPTRILSFECMDGRISIPLITGMPVGILRQIRSMGGKFTLGDPYLGNLVFTVEHEAASSGRQTLALSTYHYSKGDEHRGCAGCKYDTGAARENAFALKHEFEKVFDVSNHKIAAIVIRIETDRDTLAFCAEDGKEFKMREHENASDEEILNGLCALYPDLSEQMLHDLLPLALGNREHIKSTKNRPELEIIHNENIICFGRGFDWLHLPNKALIIGPHAYTEAFRNEALLVAGKIILNNFKNNEKLREEGALLIISSPFKDAEKRGLASAHAKYYLDIAKNALEPIAEELQLEILVGVTDVNTMKFHPLADI
jgi:hypothetical protein